MEKAIAVVGALDTKGAEFAMDCDVNAAEFSSKAAETLLEMMGKK